MEGWADEKRGIALPDLERVQLRQVRGILGPEAQNYTPFMVKHLVVGLPLPCTLYLPVSKRDSRRIHYMQLQSQGEIYSQACHELFCKKGITKVFVERDALSGLATYTEDVSRHVLAEPDASAAQKSGALHRHAEFLIEQLFHNPHDQPSVAATQRWAQAIGSLFHCERLPAALLCRMFASDYSIATHSIQVCLLGLAFGVQLGWSEAESADFAAGALLHDIGKTWIEGRILRKPGSLTDDELARIREHPSLGYAHLKAKGLMSEPQLAIVLQHHEGSDGRGYPNRLSGEAIHPLARVAHIVDCYDALTTRHRYKDALIPFRALRLMGSEMRATFDPLLLDQFIRYLGS